MSERNEEVKLEVTPNYFIMKDDGGLLSVHLQNLFAVFYCKNGYIFGPEEAITFYYNKTIQQFCELKGAKLIARGTKETLTPLFNLMSEE